MYTDSDAKVIATLAAPDRLRINLLPAPLGIPTEDPSFSWRMRVTESSTDEIQTGYRICIADRRAALEEDYLLDTGWIASDENSDVHIAGLDAILKDNELYYWSVRTRNKNGLESRMSEWQPFTTAVGEEWESTDGIWCQEIDVSEDNHVAGDDFAFLRTNFDCPMAERVEAAILSVSATSPEPSRQFVYHVFLNGSFVGLGPARLDRDEAGTEIQYYHTYDVTALLHAGANALGALCYTRAEQAFVCQLTLYYKNGTKRIVVNSARDAENWTGMNGRGIFRGNNSIGTNYFFAAAQNIDASHFPYGFDTPGYQNDTFLPVVIKPAPHPLLPFPGENVECYLCPAVSVTEQRDSGILLVDLGREIIGGLQLSINVPAECEITLRYGEELNDDGSVKYRMRTSNVYTERWLCSPDVPVMQNYGMMTYRYIEIVDCPVPLTAQNICGIAMRRPFDEDLSSFTCVNDTLCELYETFKYAICATNQDLYVDSQSRERCAYEGDVLINMLSAYTYETPGMLPRFSSRYLLTHRTWPAEYELTTIRTIALDYLYTGNRALIRECYDRLRDILARETPDEQTGLMPRRTANQHGWNAILVDWPTPSRDGYDTVNAHFNTVYNAFYFAILSDMEFIAKELGRENDRRDYRAAKEALREAMLTHLYDEEMGAFRDGLTVDGTPIEHYAQHATVFPLYAGVCEAGVADACARYIIGQGDIRTSVYGAYFLMEALYGAGFGNYATALLADDGSTPGVHSWAASLATKDITIAPEAWYVEEKNNMTFSHPWGSAPASLIARCMFGIRPTSPGFRTFQVRPLVGDLSYATIRVPTVKGTVRVSIGQNSEAYEIEVTIPANTVADIYVPVLPGGTQTLFLNDRIANYPIEGTVYHVRLGSGKYRLLSQ